MNPKKRPDVTAGASRREEAVLLIPLGTVAGYFAGKAVANAEWGLLMGTAAGSALSLVVLARSLTVKLIVAGASLAVMAALIHAG